jgi:6-pyruvoyltetrahydropterin/6-carboxytetrahydropterin synthase
VLQAARLDKIGMAMDFKEARALLAQVVDGFDHRNLNELPPFAKDNPTTENVSRVIFRELSKLLPQGITVKSITTWESERCGATYTKA